jgi:hypothetical protein
MAKKAQICYNVKSFQRVLHQCIINSQRFISAQELDRSLMRKLHLFYLLCWLGYG